MATQPIGEVVNQQEQEPIDMLRQALVESQVDATNEAAMRLSTSSKMMTINEGQTQTKTITNESISALYDRVSGTRYVGTLPVGSRVDAKTKNITERKLPTGEIELFVKADIPNVPPAKVFQAQYEAYAQKNPAQPFNLENEEAKLRGLSGEERLVALTTLLSNVDAQMTQARQRISAQAGIQSGMTAAQAALDRALAVEQLPNPNFGGLSFAQRFGVASAQTVQAQEFMRATQIAATQLENSMLNKDAEINKYASAKERLMRIQNIYTQKQLAKEMRAEERVEKALESIPQHQIANYQAMFPGTSPEDAATELLKASRENKPIFQATAVTPATIYTALTDQNLSVRRATLEVLNNNDRAINPNYINEPTARSVNAIRRFVENPALLDAEMNKLMTPKQVAEYNARIGRTPDKKEQESMKQANRANLLQAYMEKIITNTYQTDMREWNATEKGQGTVLGGIIDSVAKTNPTGKADLNTVISKFITDATLKNPDGSPLPYENRVQILQAALLGATSNEYRTMLNPDMTAIRLKLANQITNEAGRAHIRARTPSIQTLMLSPEFGYRAYQQGPGGR